MENIKMQNDTSMEILHNAIANAEVLLNYATEKGLDVQTDWISTIIEAKKSKDSGEWENDTEINFWLAYKNLSKIVQPVTIDSLKALQKRDIINPNIIQKLLKRHKLKSFSQRSVNLYIFLTIMTIFFVLSVQIFSLKGTTLLNKIQINSERIEEISLRKDEIHLIMRADPNNQRAELEKYRLEAENQLLNQEIKSSVELLDPWVKFIRNLVVLGTRKKKEVKKITDKEVMGMVPAFGPPGGGASIAEDDINSNINIIQEAQNFTQILQLYVLPLLYGLIGGFIFVLRGLVYDIKYQIFSQFSNIKYTLRIHLGAMAGLLIGLLWGDIEKQSITFLESLSTAAFAFIAGYGVEYLFDAVDRLILSFGKKDK